MIMYARFLTASLYGLSGEQTWVEAQGENGIPSISIVGLANQAVKEAKDRVHSAITNCELEFPAKKITVNLSPANRRKEGSHYDIAIALAVLNSGGLLLLKDKKKYQDGEIAFLGELSLDGRVNPVDGVLPMVIGLQKSGVKEVVIPKANLSEALLVKDMIIYPVNTLREIINHITGLSLIESFVADGCQNLNNYSDILDFSDIKGQETVKRAAQVAASGMHGLLMVGPPGVGKSMIGKRIPGILPPLSYEEQLEVTQIYSVAGLLSTEHPMITMRPFRTPHHSMPAGALIGGGNIPKPGEISLAHNGVLFLDELPEFNAHAIDMLRQPMEDGQVSINRINGKVEFPCRFMLVAAMNPCKCGYFNDPVKPCICTESDRKRYVSRVSGPLLDRMDLHVSLQRVLYERFDSDISSSSDTNTLRNGVMRALDMQKERYKNIGINYNSQLSPKLIEKYCILDESSKKIISAAFDKWNLSARSYHRILKVSRTIADLSEEENIREEHLLEALSYRMPDSLFK